jgi:hypothetical protein
MTSPPSTIMRGDTVVAKPIERHGYWRRLFVSPDRETLLAQWSGECEVPTAYLIRASGGKPRPVVDVQYESIALGWSQDGRARVLLPQGACGAGQRRPGVYLVSVGGQLTFVRAVKRRPGGA